MDTDTNAKFDAEEKMNGMQSDCNRMSLSDLQEINRSGDTSEVNVAGEAEAGIEPAITEYPASLDQPNFFDPSFEDVDTDARGRALDRQALVAFYHATDGPNWDKKHGWLTDQPLHTWHGIEVDQTGRVIVICLKRNNLRGSYSF